TDSRITVTGNNVSRVSLFSADGAAVASADSDTLPVGQLSEGIYVVKAVVDGETITRKIRIVR
ncbi:MAG: T9SS type A sorting domain-containing protein, partial [Prevotella sp.]|nr:T9SS type A sorting domain-containing protein [Prevotella sp.]